MFYLEEMRRLSECWKGDTVRGGQKNEFALLDGWQYILRIHEHRYNCGIEFNSWISTSLCQATDPSGLDGKKGVEMGMIKMFIITMRHSGTVVPPI